MNYTENLSLNKPTSPETFSVDHQNENMDTLDAYIADIMKRFGLDKDGHNAFNYAVVKKTDEYGVEQLNYWIMSNAYYDYNEQKFKRIDKKLTSIGIQIQAIGTYPGESVIGDTVNQGMNIWRANGTNIWGTEMGITDYIGYEDSNGTWREFGVIAGWNNCFMMDSYGGMTVGGAGFEVDGNGIFPYSRLSLAKFSATENDEDKFIYLGLLWNAYHQMSASDDNSRPSYFVGFKSPIDFTNGTDTYNAYSNYVDLENAEFCIMRRNANSGHDVTDWKTIFSVNAGNKSLSVGDGCTASGYCSHAEGYSTVANQNFSHTEGFETVVNGSYAHAEGYKTTADMYSHAEGDGTNASYCSHAEGRNTTANGSCSHAEGSNTTATGQDSHAEGQGTQALSMMCHAEGLNTIAGDATNSNRRCCHAEGINTKATYDSAHAEGSGTTASNIASHAEGSNTTASGNCAHAEGNETTASAPFSHAEGLNTSASQNSAHAEGESTNANGHYSHTEGLGTIASGNASHVEGRYNIDDADKKYVHIVGNGNSNTNRSNAHTLDWNGNAWFAGDVTTAQGSSLDGLCSTVNDLNKLYKLSDSSIVSEITLDGTAIESTIDIAANGSTMIKVGLVDSKKVINVLADNLNLIVTYVPTSLSYPSNEYSINLINTTNEDIQITSDNLLIVTGI